MPLAMQVKLLRVLQERTFERVGSNRSINADVRIIAATHTDLERAIASGDFREDLFYRLNVASQTLPPLREVRSDIPLLVRHFVEKAAEYFAKPVPEVDPDSVSRLMEYDWPGNVRELRNVIERAMIFCRGDVLEIPSPGPTVGAPAGPVTDGLVLPMGLTLAEVEKRYIEATMEEMEQVAEAADSLGVSRKVLWSRRKEYGLLSEDSGEA